MKTKRLFALLIAAVMLISMIPFTALTSAALEVTDKVKEVELTLSAPTSGQTVYTDYASVTVGHHMTYKVVGVNWYKDNEKAHLGIDPGADTYFIGGHSYTVRVDLALKAGNSGWNFDYQGENTDYSGVKATINGQTATVTYRDLNPDAKTISVMYTFKDIPVKSITPIVNVPAPIAGESYPDISKIVLGTTRGMSVAPSDYRWLVEENGWRKMELGEKYVAGKHYRVELVVQAKEGFRFNIENGHMIDTDRYVFGYINGKQTSMKLEYMGENDEGAVYNDSRASVAFDFVSCEAKVLDSVRFEGIQAPTEGQHPSYVAPTMGESTYILITDDAVTGGAQYGFTNGVSWSLASTALNAESVFEKGKIYTLTFFIKAGDIYRFADWMTASANMGYVEVVTLPEEPTIAMVTVEFAPCEGGVLNEIEVGSVREPVMGEKPDYDFTYGQGYGKGGFMGDIVWYDATDDKILMPSDTFAYGHTYKLRLILASDKQLNAEGKFEFAPHDSLTVKVNGKTVDSIKVYNENPETHYVQLAMTFECAKATVSEIGVKVENPYEGNHPAQQIELENNGVDLYKIAGYYFVDGETGIALQKSDVFAGGKNYNFVLMLEAKEGYAFDASTEVIVNGAYATVVAWHYEQIIISVPMFSDELPYFFVSFDPGEGTLTSNMEIIKTKEGMITLPECEFTAPEGKKFAGWTTDGGITLLAGDYKVTTNVTLTAFYVDNGEHRHVYPESYTSADDTFHQKQCISEDCNDVGGSIISEMHQYGNNTNCDVECTICGYERTVNQAGEPLHFYEHACSEFCPNCGKQRENVTHTPDAEANCSHAQSCTVCGKVLAEKNDVHTPGAEPNCTEGQKCTLCGTELKPANGHVEGVEWITDENGHHKVCGICGQQADAGEHTDADENDACDVCGFDMSAGGLGTGAIIGIIVGAVVLLGGGGFCLYWFVIRKKKNA